jgi:hypothetical protein
MNISPKSGIHGTIVVEKYDWSVGFGIAFIGMNNPSTGYISSVNNFHDPMKIGTSLNSDIVQYNSWFLLQAVG